MICQNVFCCVDAWILTDSRLAEKAKTLNRWHWFRYLKNHLHQSRYCGRNQLLQLIVMMADQSLM